MDTGYLHATAVPEKDPVYEHALQVNDAVDYNAI